MPWSEHGRETTGGMKRQLSAKLESGEGRKTRDGRKMRRHRLRYAYIQGLRRREIFDCSLNGTFDDIPLYLKIYPILVTSPKAKLSYKFIGKK